MMGYVGGERVKIMRRHEQRGLLVENEAGVRWWVPSDSVSSDIGPVPEPVDEPVNQQLMEPEPEPEPHNERAEPSPLAQDVDTSGWADELRFHAQRAVERHGLDPFSVLALADAGTLTDLQGIGKATAQELIDAAKDRV